MIITPNIRYVSTVTFKGAKKVNPVERVEGDGVNNNLMKRDSYISFTQQQMRNEQRRIYHASGDAHQCPICVRDEGKPCEIYNPEGKLDIKS